MKKILIPLLFVSVILFAACDGSDKDLVKKTGEDFVTAVLADNFTEFRTLVTPVTSEKWGTVNYHHYAILSPETKAKLQAAQPRVSDIQINGRDAQLTLAVALPGETGEIKVLHLTKIGRAWFINEPGLLVPN